MMKVILLSIFLFVISNSLKAQALEDSLSNHICRQLDSVDLQNVKTPDDKKRLYGQLFMKAVITHQKMIEKDKRLEGLSSYEQGKKVGQVVGQRLREMLPKTCPKFQKVFYQN